MVKFQHYLHYLGFDIFYPPQSPFKERWTMFGVLQDFQGSPSLTLSTKSVLLIHNLHFLYLERT